MKVPKVSPLVVTVLVAVCICLTYGYIALASRTEDLTNTTTLETARTFVEALIAGDQVKLDKLNRSNDWPTERLMSIAPDFARYKGTDFQIYVSKNFPKANVVFIKSSDGYIEASMIIDQADGGYYFMGFVQNPMGR